MGKVYNNIIETIGRTPLVKLNRITANIKPNIYGKVEAFNPGASLCLKVCQSKEGRF
jgi:cysteine synthase